MEHRAPYDGPVCQNTRQDTRDIRRLEQPVSAKAKITIFHPSAGSPTGNIPEASDLSFNNQLGLIGHHMPATLLPRHLSGIGRKLEVGDCPPIPTSTSTSSIDGLKQKDRKSTRLNSSH